MTRGAPLPPLLGDQDDQLLPLVNSFKSSRYLAPLILPGGGRCPGGVTVTICSQLATNQEIFLRWRFSMNPSGSDNGPSFEGQIPARPDRPFEEGYSFAAGAMGYRRGGGLELRVPGSYRVWAWVEDARGLVLSPTQFAAFEVSKAY